MKKALRAVLAVMIGVFLFSSAANAYHSALKTIQVDTGVRVYVNGAPLNPGELNGNPNAFAYNGTTYVPVRAIGSALSQDVHWDGYSGTVSLNSRNGTAPLDGNGVPLKWAGKKWAAVGDSLTARSSRTTRGYYDYVSAATGVEVYNMGLSDTGYKKTEELGTAFYQRIWDVPADADVVTIFGSGNDLNFGFPLGAPADRGTETLCGCINTTLDNLYVLKPTAQVGLVTPTPWKQYPPSDKGNEMELYADAIVEICRQRGIPCLDLYHTSSLRPWDEQFQLLAYSRDEGNGMHPDENGHALIAPKFAAFLENFLL